GEEVVHEGGGDGVAVIVVGQVFVEDAPDALHDAARDLALDHVRIDHRPAVLADDVSQQPDLTGDDVDLAGAHVARVHPDRARLAGVPRTRFQPGRYAGRHAGLVQVGEGGEVGERDAGRRGAAHARPALPELDVVRR